MCMTRSATLFTVPLYDEQDAPKSVRFHYLLVWTTFLMLDAVTGRNVRAGELNEWSND